MDWNGGVYLTDSGYMRETRGIAVHRRVMEQYLRRPLLPTEYVHHINGVRDDNRLENLELWTRSQPKGIRVEDAVAWAHEILERYAASK